METIRLNVKVRYSEQKQQYIGYTKDITEKIELCASIISKYFDLENQELITFICSEKPSAEAYKCQIKGKYLSTYISLEDSRGDTVSYLIFDSTSRALKEQFPQLFQKAFYISVEIAAA